MSLKVLVKVKLAWTLTIVKIQIAHENGHIIFEEDKFHLSHSMMMVNEIHDLETFFLSTSKLTNGIC